MSKKPVDTISPVMKDEIKSALLEGAKPEDLAQDYNIPEILIRKEFFDIISPVTDVKSTESSDSHAKEQKQADEKQQRQKELAERIQIFHNRAVKDPEISTGKCMDLRDDYFSLLREIKELQPSTAQDDAELLKQWYEDFFDKAIPILKIDPYKALFKIDVHNGFSEEEIKTNYRKLMLIFHPDKTQLRICDDFVGFIGQTKDGLLSHKKCLKDIAGLEERANLLLAAASDSLTKEHDLETASLYYRNALYLVESKEIGINLYKRVELRIKIARCLIAREQYTHAQLYVLGAGKLLTKTFETALTPLFVELQQLSQDIRSAIMRQNEASGQPKISGGDLIAGPQKSSGKKESKERSDPPAKSEDKLILFDKTATALTSGSASSSLSTTIQTVKRNINKDIANVTADQLERALVLSPNLFTSTVGKSIDKTEGELRVNEKIVDTVALGVAIPTVLAGCAATTVTTILAGEGIGAIGAIVATSVGVQASVGELGAFLVVVGGGFAVTAGAALVFGIGAIYLAETVIRSKHDLEIKNVLTSIKNALNYYQQKNYPKLLEELAAGKGRKRGIIHFDAKKELGYKNVSNDTIEYLTKLRIFPDLIGYVLLITAECYINRNIGKVKGLIVGRLRTEAIDILEKLINAENQLEKQAIELDELARFGDSSSADFSRIRYYYDRLWARLISDDFLKERPVSYAISQRLKMCITFARINLALEHLLSTEEAQDEASHVALAKKYMSDVENTLKTMPELRDLLDRRYDVVKDFLAILGHEKFPYSLDRHASAPLPTPAILGPTELLQKEINVYLRGIRRISVVNDEKNNSHFCQVLATPHDGNCGFGAIRQALSFQEESSDISREQFILEVKTINALLTKEHSSRDKSQFYRDWKPLIVEMYRDAKVKNFASWQEQFSKSGYWVNEAHLRFLSRQRHIEFKLYRLGEKEPLLGNSDRFIPYPQGAHIINVTDSKNQKLPRKVALLHIPLESKLGAPLIHFEGLRVYNEPSDKEIGEVSKDIVQLERKILTTATDKKQEKTCQTQLTKTLWKKALILNTKAIEMEKLSRIPEALRYWQEATHCLEKIQKNSWITLLDNGDDFFPILVQNYYNARSYGQAMFVLQGIDMTPLPKAVKAKLYYLQALIFIKSRKWQFVRGAIGSAKRNGLSDRELNSINAFTTRFLEKYEINHQSADFKSVISQRGHLLEKRYPPMESKEDKGENFSQPLHKSRRTVLSIDGGGIRGILPCVILAEIEYRTHQPIARLFDVLAGTSTGAILSAGFSVTKPDHKHYSADELLELYTTKREKIFKPKHRLKILTERYEESGLEEELQNYFGDNKLTDCKADLLITSVEVKSRQLRQFTSAAAHTDSSKDFRLKHILRASSAAPTFFKKFSLHGEVYVDGGMRANNPAQLALQYTEQRFGVTAADILLLSLGTGDYIPDPTEPYKNFSLLFWANPKNLSNIYSERLEHEVHNNMCHLFARTPGQYRRLQPMMDRPVPLDASKQEDMRYLLDVADEYVEELDAGDDNILNKTVESLTPFM